MPNKIPGKHVTVEKNIDSSDLRCIININTNIWEQRQRCWHHSHRFQNKSYKHCFRNQGNDDLNVDSREKERIVPQCFRDRKCNGGRQKLDTIKIFHSSKTKYSRTKKKKCCKCKKNTKGVKYNKKLERLDKKCQKRFQQLDLSPDSNITLPQADISYENISSESFDSDYEIDRLIERTKNREKHTDIFQLRPDTFAQFTPDRLITSTPYEEDCITLSSNTDDSIHSLSTVKLQPPTIGVYSSSKSYLSHGTYNYSNFYKKNKYGDETAIVFDAGNSGHKIEQKNQIPAASIYSAKARIGVKMEESDINSNVFNLKRS